MTQKGWGCSSCGSYAMAVCINCRRRACGQHVAELFGLKYTRKGEIISVDFLTCPSCREVRFAVHAFRRSVAFSQPSITARNVEASC